MKHVKDPEQIHARDLMSRHMVTISLDSTLEELAEKLESHHITGAPVVDDEGRFVGVVSATDVMHVRVRDPAKEEVSDYFRSVSPASLRPLRQEADPLRMGSVRVRDIFTTYVITAGPETRLPALCDLMTSHHIHRILIVDRQSLLGIVTSLDVVRWVAGFKA